MKELVGRIGVDSGQILVGDPCYLDRWGGHNFVPGDQAVRPSGAYSYQGACEATVSDLRHGELESGLACVTSTGYGDGEYPVYIERGHDGRVARMIVEFIEE